jgi:hypothetical protein
MAVGHETWTVLPHSPIEVLAPNLWRVEGQMGSNKRVMALARLRDGRIVVHNAIALDEASMERIDAWGKVAAILVPNRFHRQDAHIMHTRYPDAKVYAPAAAVTAASKATPCAGTYDDVPGDDTVTVQHNDTAKREGFVTVRSDDGISVIFCDTLLNMPRLSGVMGFVLGPTGTLSVPRMSKLFFLKDRRAFRRTLETLAADSGLVRVLPGHGDAITANASQRLQEAAERL